MVFQSDRVLSEKIISYNFGPLKSQLKLVLNYVDRFNPGTSEKVAQLDRRDVLSYLEWTLK